MGILLALMLQAAGQEITTFHQPPPQPQKQQQQVTTEAPAPVVQTAPGPEEPIKVLSVKPGPAAQRASTTVAPAAPQVAIPPAATEENSAPSASSANAASPEMQTVQEPLTLTCVGGGTASKSTGAMIYGSRGWASIVGRKDRGFNDQVDIRLFNGDDRIRVPRTMLPPIHGGEHGWFKLKNVVADARSIRASAAVGLLNNPKVFIDRVTGIISISGKSGDYSGVCDVIPVDEPAKF